MLKLIMTEDKHGLVLGSKYWVGIRRGLRILLRKKGGRYRNLENIHVFISLYFGKRYMRFRQ